MSIPTPAPQRTAAPRTWPRAHAGRLLAIGALTLVATAFADPPPRDTLDAAVTSLAEEGAFPGFCVAVVDRDSTRYLRAAGVADRAARRPYTPSTVQPVGSISKTLIGTVLARAVHDGRVSLDTPVRDLLPTSQQWPATDREFTMRQLATHTAGLRDIETSYATSYVPAASADTGFAAWLRGYLLPGGAHHQPAHRSGDRPGTRFAYTNVGAALAAYALESRAGVPFAQLVQRDVFDPLGLTQSRFAVTPDTVHDAVLYDATGAPVPPYALVTYPEGGWRTSCTDLARYARGVLAAVADRPGAFLPAPSARAMLAPQFSSQWRPADVPSREPNQGLFWQHRANGGVGHSGGDPGVTAFLLLDPVRGTGRLFMTNTEITDGNATLAGRFAALWKVAGAYEASLTSARPG